MAMFSNKGLSGLSFVLLALVVLGWARAGTSLARETLYGDSAVPGPDRHLVARFDTTPSDELDESMLLVKPSRVSDQLARDDLGNSLKAQKRASRTVRRDDLDLSPTPQPTGDSSPMTTVHITDEHDFALLLPDRPGELISDAESDGVAYCMADGSCPKRMADGFIRAAAVLRSDDTKYIQVTGCLDVSKSTLDPSDGGGQMDVRFPNGAQCTFGGYGASFIQIIEPNSGRFCLRCCSSPDDQVNCNSHQDTAGCSTVIPGMYNFPEIGVSCD